ncbi:MAG: DinB family protein [Planctomycetaceae bacterium]|nr:DinB family protein [Planctomycetaceae bacterium]
MDLLDRLLKHDVWTTRKLLDICSTLSEEQLDGDFELGHRTLRATLHHMLHNMEVWTALMAGQHPVQQADCTLPGMITRLDAAESSLASIARRVANSDAWDDLWTDTLDDPPQQKSYGTAIAHLITHNMHHRAQLLYMLRRTGVTPVPEGDVFSWEAAMQAAASETAIDDRSFA